MTDRKKGLKRPEPPIDLYTLQPEPELIDEGEDEKTQKEPAKKKRASREPSQKRDLPKAKSETKAEEVDRSERVKTTVELAPGTVELIAEIQYLHKKEKRKSLPMWKIFREAIEDLADKKRK